MPRQSELRFTFEPLQGDVFEVVEFTLEEGLSQPFKIRREDEWKAPLCTTPNIDNPLIATMFDPQGDHSACWVH
ncbi:hypothetical protein FJD38_21315 [Pseudomonas saxonica]|uniref:Uncharacterized protein n=1 Tax=Pseudomonas saxonica TaxID=2600598 RepID=A0ABY3GF06_9PSED|nr:hypothetical protein [Pseudomonas saxonica]TWR86189.1 hypothetical protein FJD38_21315 [Pseudomonas saxonica]